VVSVVPVVPVVPVVSVVSVVYGVSRGLTSYRFLGCGGTSMQFPVNCETYCVTRRALLLSWNKSSKNKREPCR